jgi:hypothetical protein
VSESECAKIRTLNEKSGERFFFQKGENFYSLLKQTGDLAALVKSRPRTVRFIFLVLSDGDLQSPMISVVQRFVVSNPDDRVKTYNNVRQHPLSISREDYQKFHLDGNHGNKYRDLLEWFHLGPGLFRNRDFVDTNHFPDPRKLMAISPPPEKTEEIRSYLFAMKGVRKEGSCIDSTPHVAASAQKLSFVIRDLRATQGGDYQDPFEVTVELP